jgi:type II secretory ATPase GspE/PulE/Tfp pilus assembly ATPase PilB-like protein
MDDPATRTAPARPTIGEVLTQANLISASQLETALAQQGQGDVRRLGDILIENGWLQSENLAMALSVHLNLPFIDLKRHRIQPDALQLVPEETSRRHQLIPLDLVDGSLAVVMEDPTDIQVIEELEAVTGRSIRPMVGVGPDIQAAIDLNYKSNRQIEREVAEFAVSPDGYASEEGAGGAEPLVTDPVVRAVDLILEQAVRDRASDIHLVPDFDSVRVRYRVDGVLQESLSLPKGSHDPLLSRVKILAGMNIAERRRPQDGQFSKMIEGDETYFRVATSDTTWGEMATLRVLGRSESILDLQGLGLSETAIGELSRLIHLPFGMVLVSGPTGSGKTTTLYAALNQLDRQQLNIMTIEDPVEYNFARINQIQVNRAADITFASGLRGVMRLDPDVIMVGEVRDGETAEAATQAALTGHLVLSSIHANDSPGASYRLAHLGVERYMISSAILGVVAQRLVRRICPHCKTPIDPSPEERSAFEADMGEPVEQVFHGEGCTYCGHTGYLGRTGVFEILRVDETMRRLFVGGAASGELKAIAMENGMQTMRQDGMAKVKAGITTVEEVVRNVAWIE